MSVAERILVGAVTSPEVLPHTPGAGVLAEIEGHALAPLAWDAIVQSGRAGAWAAPLQTVLRRTSAAHALVSELCDGELRRVVDALGRAGIPTLLVKGAALACTHYRLPHLRPRNDSDVVIDETHRSRAALVLAEIGYARSGAVDGSLVTHQAQWARPLDAGVVHAVDLHWRVFNPHAFADVLSVERLFARSVRLPQLGPHAQAPCPVDALLLACAHRVAHHPGASDPLWDFDVHLLLSALDEGEVVEFVGAAEAAGVRAVVASCITDAHARFGTPIPLRIRALIDGARAHGEPTAALLDAGRQVDVLLSDLGALGWRARLALLGQHLFPRPCYMLEKYGRRNPLWLPWLYGRRVFAGLPRWLRQQSRPESSSVV